VTLTVKDRWTSLRIIPAFVSFVDRLASLTNSGIRHFGSIETTTEGFDHIHCLLFGTLRLATKQLETSWKAGAAKVEVFNAEEGGCTYVAKQFDAHPDDRLLSNKMPPLRPTIMATTTAVTPYRDA
jgi:hypothetical protein